MKTFLLTIWHRLVPASRGRRCVECYTPIAEGFRCDDCRAAMERQIKAAQSPEHPMAKCDYRYLGFAAETTPGTLPAQSSGIEQYWLDAQPSAPPMRDDEPFQDTYPTMPTMDSLRLSFGFPTSRDGFSVTLSRWKSEPESLPPVREDWTGGCLWCAREMRELSDDLLTHRPRRVVIQTCERHRAGGLALNAALRDGSWRTRYPI